MDNSALAILDSQGIDVQEAIDSVVLPKEAITKLTPSQLTNMKLNVAGANQSITTAGMALYATANCLSMIKEDVKDKNWKALTDSGVLLLEGRQARDLTLAYDTWMRDSDIPEAALALVSIRVLYKIGTAKVTATQKRKCIELIKEGKGLTDGAFNKILGAGKPSVRKQFNDLIAKAEIEVQKASDNEKLEKYGAIVLENIQLRAKVEELEEQLEKAKKSGYKLSSLSYSKTSNARKAKVGMKV